jgi:putative flippase GtrA
LLTSGIFLVLSYITPTTLAYTIAFGLGILFSVSVAPRFVFRERVSVARRGAYAGWYVAVYAIGLGLVYALHDVLGFERWAVVVLTAVGTASLSYLGARHLFVSLGTPHDSVDN